MVTLKWAQPGAGWGTGTLLALDADSVLDRMGQVGACSTVHLPSCPLLPTGVAATLLASLGLFQGPRVPLFPSWAVKSPLLLSPPLCPFPRVPSQPWAAALWGSSLWPS